MKKIILIFSLIISAGAHAQTNLWKGLPFSLNSGQCFLQSDSNAHALYIFGAFNQINGNPGNLVKWDGKNYSVLPLIPSGAMGYSMSYQGQLYVAGGGKFYRLNGQTWDNLDNKASIGGMTVLEDKLVVSGIFNKICGEQIINAATFDGQKWSSFYSVDTLLGSDWYFQSVVRYKGNIYIAGNMNPEGKPAISEIAMFDGQHWKDVGGGITNRGLGTATKMLIWKDELYVAGDFFERDGSPGNCIAKWDGTKWSRLGAGITQGQSEAIIYDMAVFNDNLYVVGSFTEAGGIPANNIARWDGMKWCSLGQTPSVPILSVSVLDTSLYIGGFNSFTSDTIIHHLAQWQGGDYVFTCSSPANTGGPAQVIQLPAVYPNPASGTIFIKGCDACAVTVYDVTGRSVLQESSYSANKGINVRMLSSGTYLIAVSDKSGSRQILRFTHN